MFKSNWSTTVTTVLATAVMSATCLFAAVGPAQPGVGKTAVTMAAQIVA